MNTPPPREPSVRLTVWGVPRRRIPGAIARMGLHRRPVAVAPGLRFHKLLGTGNGRTFTARDADPRHWALLTVWDDDAAAEAFGAGPVHRSWATNANERLEVSMTPLASRGSWAGRQPFAATGQPPAPEEAGAPGATGGTGGPIAAITRARLRPSRAVSFWRAVPPVSHDLSTVAGLVFALGIGEAPVGLQGTFSLWRSAAELNDFAYRRAAHAEVVRRTGPQRWYTEELFARFSVGSVEGSFGGSPVRLPDRAF